MRGPCEAREPADFAIFIGFDDGQRLVVGIGFDIDGGVDGLDDFGWLGGFDDAFGVDDDSGAEFVIVVIFPEGHDAVLEGRDGIGFLRVDADGDLEGGGFTIEEE